MGELQVMTLEEVQKITTRIRENLAGIVDRFVYVGWLLNKVVQTEGYKLAGYNTVAEYAKAELGNMSADTVSRFINVFKTYGAGEETPELKEEYKAYKYSMLVEMLQLPQEDRALVSPDTPRETIRELNRFNAEKSESADVLLGWQQETAELVRTAVKELAKGYEENKLRGILEFTESKIKNLIEVICPAGHKTFKKGLVFMILTSEDIKVKIFGRENKELTWEQMAELLEETLPEPEIAPAQSEVEKIPETDISVEDPDQLPGQDSILNHPEFMPEPEIAPAQKPEKTEEQKYAEQQAEIDRKTKKKLQEMEDAEKMEKLPSETGHKTHTIRTGISYLQEMEDGRTFDLRKKEEFHIGDSMEYMGFEDGRFSGKVVKATITFILDEAAGLEDGYCILGLQIKK